MKAEELMVGDLVRVNKDNICIKKDTIVAVRGVDADNNLQKKGLVGGATCVPIYDADRMSGGVWCDFLEPIPFTEEYLVKNGFKKVGKQWEYYDDYFDLTIYEWSDSIWVFRYESTEMNTPHEQFTFSYIHELQHAFRFCAVNMEIVL